MAGVLCLAAAMLLGYSGFAKLMSPAPTREMLARLIPRSQAASPSIVAAGYLCGVAEVVIAAVFIGHGGRLTAAAVAAMYLMFAIVAITLARAPRPVGCGCFGRSDVTIGPSHIALDVVGVAFGVAAVLDPAGPLGGLTDHGPLITVVGTTQAAVLAALGLLSITTLPMLAALRNEVAHR
jgi:hypothetical protein